LTGKLILFFYHLRL